MKSHLSIKVTCSVFFVLTLNADAQGTFQNLNFESVIPPLNPDINFSVPIANALPGWTGYLTGNPVDRVLYNGISLGGPSISLLDAQTPFPSLRPLQGNNSVYLKGP